MGKGRKGFEGGICVGISTASPRMHLGGIRIGINTTFAEEGAQLACLGCAHSLECDRAAVQCHRHSAAIVGCRILRVAVVKDGTRHKCAVLVAHKATRP